MSAPSSPYVPGEWSRRYDDLPPDQRADVTEEVDRIFRQRTGVHRSLDPDTDTELVRRWLRIRDEVMADRYTNSFNTPEAVRFGLVRMNRAEKWFEIDVEPGMLPEDVVARVVFGKRSVPSGIRLENVKLFVGRPSHERWRVEWDNTMRLLKNVTAHWKALILFTDRFEIRQWRKLRQRRLLKRQLREIERQIWDATPRKLFGGRSYDELERLKNGPYEIPGRAFVWVGHSKRRGTRLVQYHELFSSKAINERIRWYLRRRTDLAEAVELEVRQSRQLTRQMIAGFALALAGAPGRPWISKMVETGAQAATHPASPLPGAGQAFDEARKLYASGPVERRIQQIAKRNPVRITKLPSRLN